MLPLVPPQVVGLEVVPKTIVGAVNTVTATVSVIVWLHVPLNGDLMAITAIVAFAANTDVESVKFAPVPNRDDPVLAPKVLLNNW